MDLFSESLNFGTVILLHKCKEAIKIQQYKPIYLLNVSFKTFTKVAMNRISMVAQKVISPMQTAFLPGRNIMERIVVLHETIHELHRKKKNGVIFKFDFEKAYDKFKWSFIQQTLKMKGFSQKWLSAPGQQDCSQALNILSREYHMGTPYLYCNYPYNRRTSISTRKLSDPLGVGL